MRDPERGQRGGESGVARRGEKGNRTKPYAEELICSQRGYIWAGQHRRQRTRRAAAAVHGNGTATRATRVTVASERTATNAVLGGWCAAAAMRLRTGRGCWAAAAGWRSGGGEWCRARCEWSRPARVCKGESSALPSRNRQSTERSCRDSCVLRGPKQRLGCPRSKWHRTEWHAAARRRARHSSAPPASLRRWTPVLTPC